MKKFISGVLTFAMLISVLPKVSFAEEEKAKSETVSKKEVVKTKKDLISLTDAILSMN